MKRGVVCAGSVLIVVAVALLCACGSSGPPSPAVVSPSVSVDRPTIAETLLAAQKLGRIKGFPYRIDVSPSPGDMSNAGTALVQGLSQSADGRWVATIRIVPPSYASSNPMQLEIAEDARGWWFASAMDVNDRRIVVSVPAQRPSTSPSPTETPAVAVPVTGDLEADLRALLAVRDAGYDIARFDGVRQAQDSRGRLWVSAWTVAAEEGSESPAVIAVSDGTTWTLVDYGTGIDDPQVPAEVRDKVWPAVPDR